VKWLVMSMFSWPGACCGWWEISAKSGDHGTRCCWGGGRLICLLGLNRRMLLTCALNRLADGRQLKAGPNRPLGRELAQSSWQPRTLCRGIWELDFVRLQLTSPSPSNHTTVPLRRCVCPPRAIAQITTNRLRGDWTFLPWRWVMGLLIPAASPCKDHALIIPTRPAAACDRKPQSAKEQANLRRRHA